MLAVFVLAAMILCVPPVLNKLHARLGEDTALLAGRLGLHLFTQPENTRADFYQKEDRKEVLITDMTTAEDLRVFEDSFENPAHIAGIQFIHKGGIMETAEAFFAKEAEYMILNDAELDFLMQEKPDLYNFARPVRTSKAAVPSGLPEGTVNLYSTPFVIYLPVYHGMDDLPDKIVNDGNILIAVNPDEMKILLVSVPGDMIVKEESGNEELLKYEGLHGSAHLLRTAKRVFGETIENILAIDYRTINSFLLTLDELEVENPGDFHTSAGTFYPEGPVYVYPDTVVGYLTEGGGPARQTRELYALRSFIDYMQYYDHTYYFDNYVRNNVNRMITNLRKYEFFTFCQRIVDDERTWDFELVCVTGEQANVYSKTAGKIVTGIRVDEDFIAGIKDKIAETLGR